MRLKAIKKGAPPAQSPAGRAEELDRGIVDLNRGRVTRISDVISDLDVTLAEMANKADDPVGHGNHISNRATTHRRPKG